MDLISKEELDSFGSPGIQKYIARQVGYGRDVGDAHQLAANSLVAGVHDVGDARSFFGG